MPRRPPVCARCYRRITFVATEATGKQMPLDPDQHGDGDVVLVRDLLGDQRAHVLTDLDRENGTYDDHPRYMPHFATCPRRQEAS